MKQRALNLLLVPAFALGLAACDSGEDVGVVGEQQGEEEQAVLSEEPVQEEQSAQGESGMQPEDQSAMGEDQEGVFDEQQQAQQGDSQQQG